MGKLKKVKKLGAQASIDADRAEVAAERAEATERRIRELAGASSASDAAPSSAQDDDTTVPARSPAYTSPRGADDTPPAAEVP